MQTPKEALLAAYRGEMPEFIPPHTKYNVGCAFPGDRFFGGEGGKDAWGVSWTNLGPDPGLDGSMVTPNTEVFDDISEWRDYVKIPDLDEIHAREILEAMMQGLGDRETHVYHVLLLSGCWERLNQLMGMENALCSFYDDPDEVHEFLNAVCDYKIKCIDLACEVMDPDVIHMHDDWGSANNLMFSPEMWREFIKPIEKRLTDHIHSKGKIYEHHSCGYIQTIIPDLIEIGVDAIDPLNITNDMNFIKENYGDKITLMGGVDNQMMDAIDSKEEDIRAEVRRAMDLLAPGGRYIPTFIYTRADVREIFMDEVEKYGKDIYKK